MIGAGGFIGSHLCEKLMAETPHVVLAVDVYNDKIKHLLEGASPSLANRIQFHRLNIKNDSCLEGLIKMADLITEQIYIGSCIQTEEDVETLSNKGVTAVLNFQITIEAANWGIDSNLINESCQKFNVLMTNYPIRGSDSFDMRKKMPFCVGLLLRLLKKNHRVFITCTTGFDRSPACVIAYLHWITDTSLHLYRSMQSFPHVIKRIL